MAQANAISNYKTQGPTKVYNPSNSSGVDQTTTGTSRAAPAHAPTPWARARDPYAAGGMTGQTFFNNQA